FLERLEKRFALQDEIRGPGMAFLSCGSPTNRPLQIAREIACGLCPELGAVPVGLDPAFKLASLGVDKVSIVNDHWPGRMDLRDDEGGGANTADAQRAKASHVTHLTRKLSKHGDSPERPFSRPVHQAKQALNSSGM